jgi:O-antigen biosynthesis protein
MTVTHDFDERLDEEGTVSQLDWFAHHARYLFASQFVQGRAVLDLACGTGYGAALLARYGARSVTAVDISEKALEEARQRHARPGVTFLQGDALDPPVNEPFDVAVSFETIEHVASPEKVLDELRRSLKPDGTLVCSTPNRDVSNPGMSRYDKPPNPFHIVELTRKELRKELQARFLEVRLYGQYFQIPGGRLRSRQLQRAARAVTWATAFPVRLPFQPLYTVAVCRGTR